MLLLVDEFSAAQKMHDKRMSLYSNLSTYNYPLIYKFKFVYAQEELRLSKLEYLIQNQLVVEDTQTPNTRFYITYVTCRF